MNADKILFNFCGSGLLPVRLPMRCTQTGMPARFDPKSSPEGLSHISRFGNRSYNVGGTSLSRCRGCRANSATPELNVTCEPFFLPDFCEVISGWWRLLRRFAPRNDNFLSLLGGMRLCYMCIFIFYLITHITCLSSRLTSITYHLFLCVLCERKGGVREKAPSVIPKQYATFHYK